MLPSSTAVVLEGASEVVGPSPAGYPPRDSGPDDHDSAPVHDVAAVLRIRPFRRLWIALGLSSLGDWLGLLALAAMAKNLASGSYTAQNFAIAGVFILRLAPAVLLGPLAGALADRLDRRWTLVVGDVARFALFASIPLVGTLTWLYTATVLIEWFALFWMPAKDAAVPNLVPRRRLEAANQISLVATYGTAPIAAAVFAGLALLNGVVDNLIPNDHVDAVSIAIELNALTFLFSALTIWRLEIPLTPGQRGAAPVGVLRSIVDGWKFVGRTPVVRGLVIGMLGAFAAAGFVVGLAQTYVNALGAGQPGFAVLFGSVFIGLAVGMWSGPRLLDEFSRRRLFGLSLAMAGAFLVLMACIPNIVLSTLFTIVIGACGGVSWVTGYTLLGLEVDDEVRGRTFAFLQSAARVVLVLVLAAGPALAAPIGLHVVRFTNAFALHYNGAAFVFLLAGVIALAMGVTSFRQMDDRPGARLGQDLRVALAARRDAGSARVGQGGYLIAFEGGDGSGKSTQARMLAEWLQQDQGHEVVLTREPGATQLGVRLRELLLGSGEDIGPRAETLLFAADRAHHVDTLIRPAMERGAVVVTDRFIDSSIAYQGAGREVDADEVAHTSRWATGGLLPDLTVLLDLPPEISRVRRNADARRTGDDRLESLPEDFHARVRARFLDLARREPDRYLVLDGSDPREQLQEAIRRRVREVVPISAKRRAELKAKLDEEERARQRRAAAEAEVLRMDAELRGRQRDEVRARQEAQQRMRAEVERQLAEEAEWGSDTSAPGGPDLGIPGPGGSGSGIPGPGGSGSGIPGPGGSGSGISGPGVSDLRGSEPSAFGSSGFDSGGPDRPAAGPSGLPPGGGLSPTGRVPMAGGLSPTGRVPSTGPSPTGGVPSGADARSGLGASPEPDASPGTAALPLGTDAAAGTEPTWRRARSHRAAAPAEPDADRSGGPGERATEAGRRDVPLGTGLGGGVADGEPDGPRGGGRSGRRSEGSGFLAGWRRGRASAGRHETAGPDQPQPAAARERSRRSRPDPAAGTSAAGRSTAGPSAAGSSTADPSAVRQPAAGQSPAGQPAEGAASGDRSGAYGGGPDPWRRFGRRLEPGAEPEWDAEDPPTETIHLGDEPYGPGGGRPR